MDDKTLMRLDDKYDDALFPLKPSNTANNEYVGWFGIDKIEKVLTSRILVDSWAFWLLFLTQSPYVSWTANNSNVCNYNTQLMSDMTTNLDIYESTIKCIYFITMFNLNSIFITFIMILFIINLDIQFITCNIPFGQTLFTIFNHIESDHK